MCSTTITPHPTPGASLWRSSTARILACVFAAVAVIDAGLVVAVALRS